MGDRSASIGTTCSTNMSDSWQVTIANHLIGQGFERIGRRRKGTDMWRRVRSDMVHHEIYITESSWNKGYLGCAVRVMFHARARDGWDEGGVPFLFEIWSGELVVGGIVAAGTPGSACWSTDNVENMYRALEQFVFPRFETASTPSGVLSLAAQLSAAAPGRLYLVFALGFLYLLVGDRVAARSSFDEYLARDPAMRGSLGPQIDALFA